MEFEGIGYNPNHERQNQNIDPLREQVRNQENLNPIILLPAILKEKMPALYSQENEQDPLVVCKFFDPVGSWTWYATEGSPVDEDGYFDTDKEKRDYLFFGHLSRKGKSS